MYKDILPEANGRYWLDRSDDTLFTDDKNLRSDPYDKTGAVKNPLNYPGEGEKKEYNETTHETKPI